MEIYGAAAFRFAVSILSFLFLRKRGRKRRVSIYRGHCAAAGGGTFNLK